MEMSDEAWYSVAKNDVFPEEFDHFLLGSPRIREAFMRHHADLLTPEFWQGVQEKIRSGEVEDFFPYPPSSRFRNAGSNAHRDAATDEVERELFGATAPHLSPNLLSEVEIE